MRWSDQLFRIFGADPGSFEATYEAYMRRVHPEDRRLAQGAIEETLRSGSPLASEYRIVLADGSIRWLHSRARLVHDEEGLPLRLLGICQDITNQKSTEAALTRLALQDPLTGLPNRALFLDRLSLALRRQDREGRMVAVLFWTSTGSRRSTTASGMSRATSCWRRWPAGWAGNMRPEDPVARLGGDEFAVLCEGVGECAGRAVIDAQVAQVDLGHEPPVRGDDEGAPARLGDGQPRLVAACRPAPLPPVTRLDPPEASLAQVSAGAENVAILACPGVVPPYGALTNTSRPAAFFQSNGRPRHRERCTTRRACGSTTTGEARVKGGPASASSRRGVDQTRPVAPRVAARVRPGKADHAQAPPAAQVEQLDLAALVAADGKPVPIGRDGEVPHKSRAHAKRRSDLLQRAGAQTQQACAGAGLGHAEQRALAGAHRSGRPAFGGAGRLHGDRRARTIRSAANLTPRHTLRRCR